MMKQSEMLAEEFGEEAQKALRTGGEWEYVPESIDAGNFFPYCCGDKECCVQWHKQWVMVGYKIRKGRMFEVAHTCDNDDNWEADDSHDVDLPGWKEWQRIYDYDASRKAMVDYFRFVVETGEDPLDEFRYVHLRIKGKATASPRKWQVKVSDWIGGKAHGLMVVGVRRRGRGPWLPLEDAPIEVRDYLMEGHPEYQYGSGDVKRPRRCLGPDLKSFGDLRQHGIEVRERNLIGTWFVTVDEKQFPTEQQTANFLRKAARKAIKRIGETT